MLLNENLGLIFSKLRYEMTKIWHINFPWIFVIQSIWACFHSFYSYHTIPQILKWVSTLSLARSIFSDSGPIVDRSKKYTFCCKIIFFIFFLAKDIIFFFHLDVCLFNNSIFSVIIGSRFFCCHFILHWSYKSPLWRETSQVSPVQ